ncbi:MAG: phage tail protein [Bacillota bacterium]
MAEPFIGEIRLFSFGHAPQGWACCDGQLLLINQNQALYSLLGTQYGGDGQTTFALPDLRGRVPVHFGNGIDLGKSGGEEKHRLTIAETPLHTHQIHGNSGAATVKTAAGNTWACFGTEEGAPKPYSTAATCQMSSAALGAGGGGVPHNNMQPHNVVNFCIALQGIYPSRN